MNSILIQNALVVTQDAHKRVISDCDVLVKGNVIAKIGRNLKERASVKISAEGKILAPGLVNTHTHLAMTLLRGYGEGLELKQWLETKIWPAEKKLKAQDVYDGSLLGCAEFIRTGTTSFADMYFRPEETEKAVVKSGLRALLSHAMLDFLGTEESQASKARKYLSKKPLSSRIRKGLGPHAIYSCSRTLLEAAAQIAREHDCIVQIHLSETKSEATSVLHQSGQKPAAYLNSQGLLDCKLVAAHCVWADQTEIDLLAHKRAAISLNCVSNLKLSSGVAPARKMLDSKALVSLGTDGAASNNSLSMLETMKTSALVYGLSAQEALDLATINGAKALHLNAGSIQEGKLADLVLYDVNALGTAPVHDPVAAIVFSSSPSSVSDVIVDGKVVMRNGKILTFNEKTAVEKGVKAARRLTE